VGYGWVQEKSGIYYFVIRERSLFMLGGGANKTMEGGALRFSNTDEGEVSKLEVAAGRSYNLYKHDTCLIRQLRPLLYK
jgi:hypothetical protein